MYIIVSFHLFIDGNVNIYQSNNMWGVWGYPQFHNHFVQYCTVLLNIKIPQASNRCYTISFSRYYNYIIYPQISSQLHKIYPINIYPPLF